MINSEFYYKIRIQECRQSSFDCQFVQRAAINFKHFFGEYPPRLQRIVLQLEKIIEVSETIVRHSDFQHYAFSHDNSCILLDMTDPKNFLISRGDWGKDTDSTASGYETDANRKILRFSYEYPIIQTSFDIKFLSTLKLLKIKFLTDQFRKIDNLIIVITMWIDVQVVFKHFKTCYFYPHLFKYVFVQCTVEICGIYYGTSNF